MSDKLTLLERLSGFPPPDYEDYWLTADEVKQIRRALAIAQAADEMASDESLWTVRQMMRCADELLRGEK